MAKGNSIKDEIKEEKKKFKTLSFTEKVQYIWQYYKLRIFAVILVVVAVGAFINSYIRTNYDTVCYIAVAQGSIPDQFGNNDILSKEFESYLGVDGKKERVDIDYNYTLVSDELDQNAVNTDITKLHTMMSTSNVEGFMTERDYIGIFSNKNELTLCDLRELLTSEEIETLSEYFVYFKDGNGEDIPFAIDVSDAPKIKDSGLTLQDPCYGVLVSSKHQDNATAFIRYVFEL